MTNKGRGTTERPERIYGLWTDEKQSQVTERPISYQIISTLLRQKYAHNT